MDTPAPVTAMVIYHDPLLREVSSLRSDDDDDDDDGPSTGTED